MSNSSIFTYKFNRYFSPYQMAWIDYGFAKKAVMPALFLAFILPVFGAIISALGIFRLKKAETVFGKDPEGRVAGYLIVAFIISIAVIIAEMILAYVKIYYASLPKA